MADQTARMKWAIPAENADPWYPRFVALMNQVDAACWAAREDRNLSLASTGNVSFVGDVVAWDAPLQVLSPNRGFLCSVPIGSVVLADGQLLYCTLTRAPATNQEVPFGVGSQVLTEPRGDDQLLLAFRYGDWVYWRNGLVLGVGQTSVGFAPVASGGGVVFGGDLTGSSGSQTVVGVQTVPVLPIVAPVDFQALLYRMGSLRLVSLTQDMILPAFAVTSFQLVAGTLIEVGVSLATPAFTAAYSQVPPYTSVVLTDTDGTPAKDVTGTPTAFTSNGFFQKLAYGQGVTYTVTVDKDGIVRTAAVQKLWVQKAYWFVSTVPGAYDQAWVEGKSAGTLVTTRNRSFSVTAGAGEYVYYVYRDGYGTGRFWVGGFEGGFTLEATIPMTRNGVTENYRIYRSINPSLGALTVTVTD